MNAAIVAMGTGDFEFDWGWGYLEANQALVDNFDTSTGTVTNGQEVDRFIDANQGQLIVVTLTWNRHMTDASTVEGYSDLDLRIFAPDGSQEDISFSNEENIEMIYITALETGEYRIEVEGDNVPAAIGTETFALAANRQITTS